MSTAMLSQPTTVSIPATMPTTASPTSPTKKRRRRAPVTGAAEDCFTCRGIGVKCDRRRPYCGPCLDAGMPCKGYRTQLTWNVGVASRGKLRGMTLPITTAAMIEQQKDAKRVTKKSSEDKGTAEDRRKARNASASAAVGYANEAANRAQQPNSGKLTIVTNYDFVNMEPPSTGSSATSRASSALSAPPSAAMSAGSPALRGLPPHRLSQDQRSPQSGLSSPYSATSQPPHYHSPVPPQQQLPQGHHHPHHQPPPQQPQQPQQHYQHSPVNGGQFRKSPYPQHVTLPPQQQPTPSMLLSPMSEYEPSYPPPQQYAISSAPASAPLYDVVTGVSSSTYHPSPAITVTSSAGSFAPMSAPAPAPPRMVSDHYHHVQQQQQQQQQQHHHHPNGQNWNGQNVAVGNLHHHQHVQSGSGNLSDLLYDEDMLASGHSGYVSMSGHNLPVASQATASASSEVSSAAQHSGSDSIAVALPAPGLSNISPDLKFLIDYYDTTVCPSLVVIDGPTNPYRHGIIQMALFSPALLEAVYALSRSHLYSRKRMGLLGTPRSPSHAASPQHNSRKRSSTPDLLSSYMRDKTNGDKASVRAMPLPSTLASVAKDTSDSSSHKNRAIQLLNAQLTNPDLARSDPALATLLILLWYHICETGVSNFKTHLAGVKKLLGMREVGKETGRWGWMETVFTWLDSMDAAVNDREAQLRGGYLDMIFESTDRMGLENLTGCDRVLFMRLAGLGRINMLSQMPTTNSTDSSSGNDERNEKDGRSEFWLAWNAMKRDLEHFVASDQFAPTSMRFLAASSRPTSDFEADTRDAAEKSEWIHAMYVYRYAALLYLDRLAYPHLPSAHDLFQRNVQQVMHNLSRVPFVGLGGKLLWPLFMIGAECTTKSDQSIIRERCLEMQRTTGFFNKFTGLEVLEKLWLEGERDYSPEGQYERNSAYFAGARRPARLENMNIGGRGLRWRMVASPSEGEYLMV